MTGSLCFTIAAPATPDASWPGRSGVDRSADVPTPNHTADRRRRIKHHNHASDPRAARGSRHLHNLGGEPRINCGGWPVGISSCGGFPKHSTNRHTRKRCDARRSGCQCSWRSLRIHTRRRGPRSSTTPQDRAAASDALLRHFGGRLIGLYYTPRRGVRRLRALRGAERRGRCGGRDRGHCPGPPAEQPPVARALSAEEYACGASASGHGAEYCSEGGRLRGGAGTRLRMWRG